jgi:hypothetical protein
MDSIMPVLLMTRGGQTIDTLAWVAGRNAMLSIPTTAGGFVIGRQVFGDGGLTIVSPKAPIIFSVDRSVPTVPRNAVLKVAAIQASADTIWSKTYAYIPRPVEKARADSFLTSNQRSLARAGISASEVRRALFIPEYYSPVSSAVAASDGSLWLRREEGRPTVDYWVIDENGELKAMLTVAASVTLMAVTNSHAWGVEKDAFDVPTVVRYRIQRS